MDNDHITTYGASAHIFHLKCEMTVKEYEARRALGALPAICWWDRFKKSYNGKLIYYFSKEFFKMNICTKRYQVGLRRTQYRSGACIHCGEDTIYTFEYYTHIRENNRMVPVFRCSNCCADAACPSYLFGNPVV